MFLISPHKDAPLFSRKDSELVLSQSITEIENGSFSSSEVIRDLFRQTSLVSLWFFIKFVCGYSAPVDRLNTGYQLEVCNFYQEHSVKGDRSFVFLPRGHLKSKICTIHGTNWDLIRDPNLTIKIFNAKEEFAFKFMHQIQRVFDSNPFFQWLFPEFVPGKGRKRWNDHELVLPNRTIAANEANVEAGGISGASEGLHYRVLKPDDIFGMKALNSQMEAGAIMEQAKNWFKTATTSLLDGVQRSRVFGAGTRWSADDGYEDIWTNCKELVGFPHEDYVIDKGNTWNIYYRPAIENGKPIFSEDFPIEFYEDLAEADPWSYATQYLNQPSKSGLAELSDYEVGEFHLEWNDVRGWLLVSGNEKQPLSDCDCVQSCDPAASEKKANSRTSRSAIGMIAKAPDNKVYVFRVWADYTTPTEIFNRLRKDKKIFKSFIRCLYLEAQGAFKILGPVFNQFEQIENNKVGINGRVFLHIREASKIGEKDAVIRSTLEPILSSRLLYVEKNCKIPVMEELKLFPNTKKKDILDMICLGINNTFKPETEEEKRRKMERKKRFDRRRVGIAGY